MRDVQTGASPNPLTARQQVGDARALWRLGIGCV